MRQIRVATGARALIRPFYNERIFRGQTNGSALDSAKTALLQYNIMIDRGIVPDALTYTSLIDTMGKARLEWQAYKLFSSMIDQGLEPVPETLVALRSATSPSRKKLIDDITARLEGAVQDSPHSLVREAEDAIREDEASEQMKIDNFFREESLTSPESLGSHTESDPIYESSIFVEDEPSSAATVGIDHPVHSWNVYSKKSDDASNAPKAKGAAAEELRVKLSLLHEEELKIFLTIHKLMRNGTRDEMISRILSNVPGSVITAMLHRRHKYFRAVEDATKVLLDNASASFEDDARVSNAGPDDSSERMPHAGAAEAHSSGGDLLYTPWGAIRKPQSTMPEARHPVVTKEMTKGAWEEVILRVTTGDTDQIPDSILRQYAAHYSLSWNRAYPDSLIRAVEWHVENVLPSMLQNERQAPPTLAMKLRRQETQGTTASLENYEALRIIAKRTKNLQVTDGVNEINTSVRRAAFVETRAAEKSAQDARQRANVNAAEELKRRATQYSPSEDRLNFGQVLHEKHKELLAKSSRVMVGSEVSYIGSSPDKLSNQHAPMHKLTTTKRQKAKADIESILDSTSTELPPWELDSASQPFNVDSGRFGDPTMGRYMELNDGNIQLMPQHESLAVHHAASALLPKQDREALLRHKVHLDATRQKDAAEQSFKENVNQFRRFKQMVARSQERSLRENVADAKVEPVQERRRMRYTLRTGRDKKAIDRQRFERFTRPQ